MQSMQRTAMPCRHLLMLQLCAECVDMRVFSVHILYQLGLTELAQQCSKAPKGSVPAYDVHHTYVERQTVILQENPKQGKNNVK